MRRRMLALVTTVVMAGGTLRGAESDAQKDVMGLVHQFVDAFNKGDTKTAVAACADDASIIDEFPPYEWHGAAACAKWVNDYDADAKANAITDGVVALKSPRHVDIKADRAYVVVPADYAYKMKGKAVKETNSMLTVALQKGAAGWRVVGWTWTKN